MSEQSAMPALGTAAPAFRLPDPAGKIVSLDDFNGARAYLIVFICNHCPYVKHVQAPFTKMAAEYQARGVAVIGINANDAEAFPEDSPEKMADEIKATGYTFPYLYDESQDVARAFRAACTPDFFLFDGERRLVFRGQFDDSRPKNGLPVTGADLRAALDTVLAGGVPSPDQKPSVGCSIKWKRQGAVKIAN
jgi:peroxiredoxin